MSYYESSAKSGNGLTQAFLDMTSQIVKVYELEKQGKNSITGRLERRNSLSGKEVAGGENFNENFRLTMARKI